MRIRRRDMIPKASGDRHLALLIFSSSLVSLFEARSGQAAGFFFAAECNITVSEQVSLRNLTSNNSWIYACGLP